MFLFFFPLFQLFAVGSHVYCDVMKKNWMYFVQWVMLQIIVLFATQSFDDEDVNFYLPQLM